MPKDELVAVVARAIEIALEGQPTSSQIYNATERGLPIPVSALDGLAEAAIAAARPAILEELREPTPAMLDAFVARALQVSIHGEGGWSNYARNQWQTMFDAAIRAMRGEG